jgi:hypothetical protein
MSTNRAKAREALRAGNAALARELQKQARRDRRDYGKVAK